MAAHSDWTIVIIVIIVLVVLWLLFNNNNSVNVEGFDAGDDTILTANLGNADLSGNPPRFGGNGNFGGNRNNRNRRRNGRPANLSNCVSPPYLNLRCTVNQLYNGTDIDSALENCTVAAKVKPACRRALSSNQV